MLCGPCILAPNQKLNHEMPTGIKTVPLPSKCVHCDPMVSVHCPRSGYHLDSGNPVLYGLSKSNGERRSKQAFSLLVRSNSLTDRLHFSPLPRFAWLCPFPVY
jgi:hypothetical protein